MSSIYDVAKQARVSAATVSRVLNGGSVSPKTKARVEKAIAAIGYEPDSLAVSLRKGKVRKIGVVVPDIGNPAYALTVKIAHDTLWEKKYSIILSSTYVSAEDELRAMELMLRERVAGILFSLNEGKTSPEILRMQKLFVERGIHMVFLGQRASGIPADSVSVDNEIALQKCVRYLKRTGRKKIAFLAGSDERAAAQERRDGFLKAMNEVGLPPVAAVCEGLFARANGEALAERLLAAHKIDALVCGNDLMAVGALRAARNFGLNVPNDLGIIGFDDIELASLVEPSLTTVHQPFDRIVNKACSLITGRINGSVDTGYSDLKIEPEVIVRESA